MNTQRTHGHKHTPIANADGTTLLEVLLAIVIFVVGMLALASLQGNLTRSSSDSNMRTVATNIAEETIEGMRAFEVIATEAGKRAYDDIVDTNFTEQRGGVDYTVDVNVKDYFFMPDRVTVTDDLKDVPAGVVNSSFKYVELTVTWNTGIEFQIDQGSQTDDRLGSGNITVSGVIPSISSLNNAKVASESNGALGYPPVNYTPGLNPDIVAISLGEQKFKESTTPDPVVRRENELVETWFDVITYSQKKNDKGEVESTFLRREEFASISCECTLRGESGSGADGRLPTTWNGAEYDEGATVGKQFGESVKDKDQSQYCEVCCKDHHDDGGGSGSYRPLAGDFSGDHKHYNRDGKGVLKEVAVGKDYIEACRLVRKDGFFRVAQDFMLQSQTAFPEDYLDETGEVDDYSAYVTGAVEHHFEVGGSWPAHGLDFDGRDSSNPTALPTTWSGEPSQQLRSRGIYTDVVSTALQSNLDNCFDFSTDPPVFNGADNEECLVKNISSPLEIYPFFDVQLTLLSRWTDSNKGDPFVVSNEELATDNTHSRGVASLAGSEVGLAAANSNIETGNVGLISIAEVAVEPASKYLGSDLYISADGGTSPPPNEDPVVSGSLTAEGGTTTLVQSVAGGGGATCTRPDNDTFTCVIAYGSATPTITVGNYFTKVKGVVLPLKACSTTLELVGYTQGDKNSNTSTTFKLPVTSTTGVVITICPA